MSILCHKCVTAINELTDYKMLFPCVVLQTVFVLFYRTLPCRLHQLYKRRASLTVLSLLHSVHPVSTQIQWGNLGRTSCVYGSLVKSKWLFDLLYKRVLWFRVLSYLNFSHILCIKFLFLEPLTFSEKSLCCELYTWIRGMLQLKGLYQWSEELYCLVLVRNVAEYWFLIS